MLALLTYGAQRWWDAASFLRTSPPGGVARTASVRPSTRR